MRVTIDARLIIESKIDRFLIIYYEVEARVRIVTKDQHDFIEWRNKLKGLNCPTSVPVYLCA